MSVYKRGNTYWYDFLFAGKHVQESAKTASKTLAKEAEKQRRSELESGFNNLADRRKERVRTLADLTDEYLKSYVIRHKAVTFATYATGHVRRLLGEKIAAEISDRTVKDYQSSRLREKASHKSINEEVGFLLRILGTAGDALRGTLHRQKALKLAVQPQPGKAFRVAEKDAMIAQAARSLSPLILPALTLALNAGLRDAEIRRVRWKDIDFEKAILTVGKSKSVAGENRTIPLNAEILHALVEHAKWYTRRFHELKPEWYVFPFGRGAWMDPSRPITSFKKAWAGVRKRADVSGRWHDARHTLITELAESGAGDETIMSIAGHVSRAMLSRYSHIRTQAKRNALEQVLEARKTARKLTEEPAHGRANPAVN